MPPIIPPHVTPPKSVRPSLKLLEQSARCILETWPEEIYTAESYRPPVKRVLYVMKPEAIAEILVTQSEKFVQSHLLRRIIKPVWRGGIATSLGAPWRWQRRAAAPVFTPKSVAAILPAANRAASDLCAQFRRARGAPHEITTPLGNAVQQVVLDSLLGTLSGAQSAARLQRDGAALTQQTGRINYADLLMLPDWTRRFLGPTLAKPATALHREVGKRLAALAQPQSDTQERAPLLEQLRGAKDPETGQSMSLDRLRDNIVGCIAAGRETTALSLSWALYLLALDPETQSRVHAEILAASAGPEVKEGDLEQLPLTRAVLFEAMRLYPPAPQIARDCIADARIAGLNIKKGTIVTLPIYAIHRSPRLWEQPNAFLPERFLAADAFSKGSRFRYLPFGGGGRICLGQAFAMTEAMVILARILRAFDIADATAGAIRFETGATLRAKDGITLRFTPR